MASKREDYQYCDARCCNEAARPESGVTDLMGLTGLARLTLDRRAFLRRAALLGAAGVVMLSPEAWAARALGDDSSR
jgi:hypothetical protein